MVGGGTYVFKDKQRQLYTLMRKLRESVEQGDHDRFCRITGLVIVDRLKEFNDGQANAASEVPVVYNGLVCAIEECMNGGSRAVLMGLYDRTMPFVQTMRAMPSHPSRIISGLASYMKTETGPAEDSLRNAIQRLEDRLRVKRHLYHPTEKVMLMDYETMLAAFERQKRS